MSGRANKESEASFIAEIAHRCKLKSGFSSRVASASVGLHKCSLLGRADDFRKISLKMSMLLTTLATGGEGFSSLVPFVAS